jgi:hypothetical protein
MITPGDSPAAPEQYAAVPVSGFNIQADQADQADLSGLVAAAKPEAMARQPQTEALLTSDQGYGEISITAGSSGGAGEDWPSDISPA